MNFSYRNLALGSPVREHYTLLLPIIQAHLIACHIFLCYCKIHRGSIDKDNCYRYVHGRMIVSWIFWHWLRIVRKWRNQSGGTLLPISLWWLNYWVVMCCPILTICWNHVFRIVFFQICAKIILQNMCLVVREVWRSWQENRPKRIRISVSLPGKLWIWLSRKHLTCWLPCPRSVSRRSRASGQCPSTTWRLPFVPVSLPAETTDAMEKREEETVFSIWVNWERRVISFTQAEGFEELQNPDHDEMFRFVIEKGNEGFGIQ